MLCPVRALQSVGERGATARRGFEDAALRATRALLRFGRSDDAEAREFVERIVNLRPRNSRPVANLPEFKQRVGLLAVHGSFGEKAEQDQIGSG